MTTMSHAAVQLQASHETITRALDEIAAEWAELGVDTPVIDEDGEIDPDAILALQDRL